VNSIGDRLGAVHDRIVRACQKAGRQGSDVRLIAVSKKVDTDRIRVAADLGVTDFGENYIQEARAKIEMLPEKLCWHMIGHVQTNKIKYIPGLFKYVHSVDRQELLDALEKFGKPINLLFEVNLSGEPQKHGADADGLKRMLERGGNLKHIKPVGLMTMAPYVDDPEESRHLFANLRKLLENLNREFALEMRELSMGMSSDFEVAIEEGATMVRIGTALFGERA
jgi:pyridoxal phosphate enzyme (YggS family)